MTSTVKYFLFDEKVQSHDIFTIFYIKVFSRNWSIYLSNDIKL